MLQKYGDFFKQIILNVFIFNFVRDFWGFKREVKTISFMGNLEEQISNKKIFIILKYWSKIVNTEENKFIKCIY